MKHLIVEVPNFQWIDVIDPTAEELTAIAQLHSLDETSLQDCLDSGNLPKHERLADVVFLILRFYGQESCENASTVRELTNKIAVFARQNIVLTIHKSEEPFLFQLKKKWARADFKKMKDIQLHLVVELADAVFMTYEHPLQITEDRLEEIEFEILGKNPERFVLQEAHYLKKRLTSFRKMLRMLMDVVHRLNDYPLHSAPLVQDLREEGERMYFYADQLFESVNQMINTYLSLASHRANEIVRVLTLFSVFFMPLNFIAGVYGMNFKYMPELEMGYGYPAALLGMLAVTLGIYAWFHRRGWMK